MTGDHHSTWSIGLGRWYGVHVRMHMFFFVFALVAFYFGWQAATTIPGTDYYLTSFAAIGILLGSILIHEIAHGFTASGYGGRVTSIEVFPWGGQSDIQLPADKYQRFLVHVSGPAANLLICLACSWILIFEPSFASSGSWSDLFYPLRPMVLSENQFATTVGLIFWINWLVFLINMLPVSPFDGGRIVRSMIPLLWPNTTTDQVYLGSMIVSMMTSIGLCILAWLARESATDTVIPIWLVLLLLATVVFFGARRQTQLDLRDLQEVLDDDSKVFEGRILNAIENRAYDEFDDDSEEEHKISDWLHQHQFEADDEHGQDASTDEERVDEILGRINEVGFKGLSEYERFVLMRASAKYRQRNG